MNSFEVVKSARDPKKPTAMDYINRLFSDFTEFHGDRKFGDDHAMITGVARFADQAVTVIAQEKGRDTKSRIYRNFGSASPEGYRKSLRQMKLAEKFRRPIICFVDTAGAHCGIEAEERGQGQAIADNLFAMSGLTVPIISFFVGEGGSGGALALGVADRIYMMENSYYSVISPEGCASILWKDPQKVSEASDQLKLTPQDHMALQLCDGVVPEQEGFGQSLKFMQDLIETSLLELLKLKPEELVDHRYQRLRRVGKFKEMAGSFI